MCSIVGPDGYYVVVVEFGSAVHFALGAAVVSGRLGLVSLGDYVGLVFKFVLAEPHKLILLGLSVMVPLSPIGIRR